MEMTNPCDGCRDKGRKCHNGWIYWHGTEYRCTLPADFRRAQVTREIEKAKLDAKHPAHECATCGMEVPAGGFCWEHEWQD